MHTIKKIEHVFSRPAQPGMVGDGFRVYNYFPNGYRIREKVSPFLMLDFGPEFDFGPSDKPRGVDVHPHKGFETVTIAYKGSVEHYDSAGNRGVIHPGDVQWMTAGAGILHKEFHEKEFSKKGGLFEMVQLWVNLPAKDKLTPPKYQSLISNEISKVILPNQSGEVHVIAGSFDQIQGSASTFTEMNVFDIHLNEDGEMSVDIPAGHNTSLLVVEGQIVVNGQQAGLHDFILFKNEGETIQMKSSAPSILLLLSGVPINEPIAQYGPFVMNTPQEIEVAFQEFQSGKFGTLH
ncbi:putative quercetin 2,3-dioxygenase PA2418 [Filimonas sp.]|nr:putative quercetin 2,3-dioxygenase PA2418 [Filimonas sp.]